MSQLLEGLRKARAESAARAEQAAQAPREPLYAGLVPPEYTRVIDAAQGSGWADIMKQMEITVPLLPQELREVPELNTDVTSHNDFIDTQWSTKDAIVLKMLENDEVIQLGRQLIGSLADGVSQRLVGSIFQIAFQLKRPDIGTSTRLLPEVDELGKPSDFGLDALDTGKSESLGAYVAPTEEGSPEIIAQGYAYLATSLLKMFTRSAENYDKSWTHITGGFRKFYSRPIPITGVTPSLGVIRQIHDHFSISVLMKATLYRLLYNANKTGEISNVQKYLYDIHLSHTGMHAVPMAYKICLCMSCTPGDLLRVMYARRFLPQIKALVEAFKLMKNKDANHQRQMWKYGRIFDSNFFAALQTRACPKFGFLMACILKRESAQAHAGILEIKQFEEIGEEDREKLQEGSKLLIRALNKIVNADEQSLIANILFV
uniref:Nucleoprotein n=1 Tax=Vincetoxicum virus 1 TaxID=2977998 RepID=A0A9N6YJL6_9RHAB|nr:TPA_asm: nucleocapsid protein [Vincetoxicum virus 1]